MPNWNSTFSVIFHLPCLLIGLAFSQVTLSADLEKSLNEASLMHQQGATSQALILTSKNTTQKLLTEFQSLNNELDQLKLNQAHLRETQTQQSLSIKSLQTQLTAVDATEKSIIPHLLSMIDWLEIFIRQDMPFHSEERQKRIDYLKATLIDPKTSLPERYRSVLEAYQIESEYGYTVEAYPQTITLNSKPLHVKLLRIGRVGLYFQSEDGQNSGYWGQKENAWLKASADLKVDITDEIKQGLLIAQKQRPHTLLSLPVTQ